MFHWATAGGARLFSALPSRQRPSSTVRIFGADVARASAIIFVFVCHFLAFAILLAGRDAVPFVDYVNLVSATCGLTGVELFFVLSGYLIGGLLIDIAYTTPTWRQWLIFMVRRWMRTIPSYAVCVIVLLFVVPPAAGRWSTLASYLTFTQDFFWPMPADNWFGVSWSLTVEEWFYLLFSSLLICLAGFSGSRSKSRSIAISLAVFLVVPLLLRLIFASHVVNWDSDLRKITAFRLDAIAYGVLLAWLMRSSFRLGKPIEFALFACSVAATLGIAYFLFFGNQPGSRPWLFSAAPIVLVAAMPFVLHLPSPGGLPEKLIEWISTRSYTIYLVHLSVIVYLLMNPVAGPGARLIIGVVATLVIAELLHRLVEQPILRLRPSQSSAKFSLPSLRHVLRPAAAATGAPAWQERGS